MANIQELEFQQQTRIELSIGDIIINSQNILSQREIQHYSYVFNIIVFDIVGILEEILYLEKLLHSKPQIRLRFLKEDQLIRECTNYQVLDTKISVQPQIEQQEQLISSSSTQIIQVKLVDDRFFQMLNNYSCKSFKNMKVTDIVAYIQKSVYGFTDQIIEPCPDKINITKQFVNDLEFISYLQVLSKKNYIFSVRFDTVHFHSVQFMDRFGTNVLDYRSSSVDKILETYLDSTKRQNYLLNVYRSKQYFYDFQRGSFQSGSSYGVTPVKDYGYQQSQSGGMPYVLSGQRQIDQTGTKFHFQDQLVGYKAFQNSFQYNSIVLQTRLSVPYVLYQSVTLENTVNGQLDGKYFVQGLIKQYNQQNYTIVELQRLTK